MKGKAMADDEILAAGVKIRDAELGAPCVPLIDAPVRDTLS